MIGIFDSGIGGLTVVKEFLRYLPDHQIIYFGDTARLPYGTKSPKFIENCSGQIVEFLLSKGAKAIVIACHTASALAADSLKEKFKNVPIFEIITPGIKKATRITQNKKIGVIGTPGTIKSGVHERELLKIEPDLKIYTKACPLFVPLVEEGWIHKKETKSIIKNYLGVMRDKKVDSLILACTHYPLLKDEIAAVLGKKVSIINPAYDLSLEFREKIKNDRKFSSLFKKGKNHQFFVSDNPYNFQIMSRLCLGIKINPKIIELA